MKRFPIYLLIISLSLACLCACSDDDNGINQSVYISWAEKNSEWLAEMQQRTNPDGTPYYQTIVPAWNPGSFVLIHYFNDTRETEGNLSPLSTSTIDARYIGRYCNDVAFDSSTTQTKWGPGIYRVRLDAVIPGWTAAFETMHVGDTAEIIIPYAMAYGTSSTSVPPYSNLRFNVRLVDIPYYEKNPK